MEKHLFVEELKRLLVSCKYNESLDFCRENMRTAMPSVLYKYTSIADYSVENLQNKQLYLNNPREFNDPFDCWLHNEQAMDCLFSENERTLNIDVTSIKDSFYKTINSLVDKTMRVGCLSEVCPTKIIMWSHYGAFHKGMCLEYDFSNCFDTYCNLIRPIIYSDAPLIIKPDVASDYESWSGSMLLLAILSKSNEWAYEKEWRLVKYNTSNDDHFFHIQCLKHIYLGVCVEERGNDEKETDYHKRMFLTQKVIKFANENKIPISKMKRENDVYKLKPSIIGLTSIT